jgi:hypothetical protein
MMPSEAACLRMVARAFTKTWHVNKIKSDPSQLKVDQDLALNLKLLHKVDLII